MSYKTLETGWANNNLQITTAKLCGGGAYMTDGGPNEQICKTMRSTKEGREEISRYNCGGGGYNGRPVHLEFTPMTNDLWKNERYNPPISGKKNPKVL